VLKRSFKITVPEILWLDNVTVTIDYLKTVSQPIVPFLNFSYFSFYVA
jgi:hypothetical protein